jgi:hypothetical protein
VRVLRLGDNDPRCRLAPALRVRSPHADQGSTMCTPHPLKSELLRVTMVRPRTRAVAAIKPSARGRGLPTCWRGACNSPQARAMDSSMPKQRSPKVARWRPSQATSERLRAPSSSKLMPICSSPKTMTLVHMRSAGVALAQRSTEMAGRGLAVSETTQLSTRKPVTMAMIPAISHQPDVAAQQVGHPCQPPNHRVAHPRQTTWWLTSHA